MAEIKQLIYDIERCTCRVPDACVDCSRHDRMVADGYIVCMEELLKDALPVLRRHEPKRPIHIHQEYKEHAWALKKDGTVDTYYYESGYCHGPFCKRCGHNFCECCWPKGWNVPCVIDVDLCPNCERPIEGGDKFCHDCGQELNWE